jgi:hypothetical protein
MAVRVILYYRRGNTGLFASSFIILTRFSMVVLAGPAGFYSISGVGIGNSSAVEVTEDVADLIPDV